MNKKKVPLSRDEKDSIYLSAFLFFVGYGIAAYTCPNILPKFGGLIICLGVLFSMKGLPDKLEALKEIAKEECKEPLAALEEMSRQGIISQEKRNEQLKIIEAAENTISQHIFSAKRRLLLIEGSIIVFGTLVNSWGEFIVYSIKLNCQ